MNQLNSNNCRGLLSITSNPLESALPPLPFDITPKSGRVGVRSAANDNGGRRLVIQFGPIFGITNAEIEVFGSFLGDPHGANDNEKLEEAF